MYPSTYVPLRQLHVLHSSPAPRHCLLLWYMPTFIWAISTRMIKILLKPATTYQVDHSLFRCCSMFDLCLV